MVWEPINLTFVSVLKTGSIFTSFFGRSEVEVLISFKLFTVSVFVSFLIPSREQRQERKQPSPKKFQTIHFIFHIFVILFNALRCNRIVLNIFLFLEACLL
jgi:hypothetical protein